MKTIKSVSEIPTKFRTIFGYRNNLTDIEWYKELAHRTYYRKYIETMNEEFIPTLEEGEYRDNFVKELLNGYFDVNNSLSSINYDLRKTNSPIENLNIQESAYISSILKKTGNQELINDSETLLNEWDSERLITDELLISNKYSKKVKNFFHKRNINFLNRIDPIENLIENFGNPFLSYGTPLNGYPITVDTAHDDETLVSSFKEWLKNRREMDSEKVRRPFNDGDFKDWSNYKIRELFDIELWARLSGLKILDRVLADYLWPTSSDDFSPIDVLRTTTRKKMQEMFSGASVTRFYSQLKFHHGENFLD